MIGEWEHRQSAGLRLPRYTAIVVSHSARNEELTVTLFTSRVHRHDRAERLERGLEGP